MDACKFGTRCDDLLVLLRKGMTSTVHRLVHAKCGILHAGVQLHNYEIKPGRKCILGLLEAVFRRCGIAVIETLPTRKPRSLSWFHASDLRACMRFACGREHTTRAPDCFGLEVIHEVENKPWSPAGDPKTLHFLITHQWNL
nr:hypothetical protein PHYPA_011973 [Physcomitrium patens]